MRSEAFPRQHSRIIRIVQRWELSFSEVFLSKCLLVNKRGELNDEWNTFKIETVDELESSCFDTMLILNISGRLLVTLIEVGGGGTA